jgi:hypothetical protein
MAVIAVFALLPIAAHAAPSPMGPQAGDTYVITVDREMAESDDAGSSSSSTDRDSLVEHVIAVRDGGLELEYDLPKGVNAQERAMNWQVPVFKPATGPMQLLNTPELEKRRDAWLKDAGMTPAACGQWVFTWTAIQIQCDPQAAIQMLQTFDLDPHDLHEGAPYMDAGAMGSAPLTKKAGGAGGPTFVAALAVDPERVRREEAESDVVVAQVTKQPAVTVDAALHTRAAESISGTISIAFETDAAGNVLRRTKVTKTEIKKPGGPSKTQTVTETTERRLTSRH